MFILHNHIYFTFLIDSKTKLKFDKSTKTITSGQIKYYIQDPLD